LSDLKNKERLTRLKLDSPGKFSQNAATGLEYLIAGLQQLDTDTAKAYIPKYQFGVIMDIGNYQITLKKQQNDFKN
jgi:hypothetical protein